MRTLGRFPYCADCANELLDDIRERVMTREGIEGFGRRVGQLRPEYGRRVGDLKCSDCSATWCGIPGDPCPWCERAAADMRAWQAELTLTPPNVVGGPDSQNYDGAMTGWAERLAVAVSAGIITEAQAQRAIDREVRRAAAAAA